MAWGYVLWRHVYHPAFFVKWPDMLSSSLKQNHLDMPVRFIIHRWVLEVHTVVSFATALPFGFRGCCCGRRRSSSWCYFLSHYRWWAIIASATTSIPSFFSFISFISTSIGNPHRAFTRRPITFVVGASTWLGSCWFTPTIVCCQPLVHHLCLLQELSWGYSSLFIPKDVALAGQKKTNGPLPHFYASQLHCLVDVEELLNSLNSGPHFSGHWKGCARKQVS